MVLHTIELCAGYGGFTLAFQAAGIQARTVCYVEREAFAAAVLAHQMEQGQLDEAPIWSDLATFDGRPWRGKVDLITAGFPCQPWSAAGKRLGESDERYHGVWPNIARITRECRPGFVFLENVSLDAFRGPRTDLEDLGYRVSPAVRVSASDVGAPHRRDRWWCLAADAEGIDWWPRHTITKDRQESGCGRQDVADAEGSGTIKDISRIWSRSCRVDRGEKANRESIILDDSNIRRHMPSQEEISARRDGLIGSGWWSTEPDVGRVAHGVADRVDRLRLLGNGIVPMAGAVAFRYLMESRKEL